MDRTVPQSSSEDIALYTRTYYSLLRSSREIKIKTLIEAHMRMDSALHVNANSRSLDMSAFVYSLLRLPKPALNDTRLIVMGQSETAFIEHGYPDIESWELARAPARRRRTFYNGTDTIAAYIASKSDIDDIVPMLTALQIERDKLQAILKHDDVMAWLNEQPEGLLSAESLTHLSTLTDIPVDDLDRLQSIWRDDMVATLRTIATKRVSLCVRSLAGSLADYKRATRRWWENAAKSLPHIEFWSRPIYFVSSNTHSLANLLSGYALRNSDKIEAFIADSAEPEVQAEFAAIKARDVPSRLENFLYYALNQYEQANPSARKERLKLEESVGVYRVPSQHVFDIEIQVFDLSKVNLDCLDPRLCRPEIEQLKQSNALVVNIDYPLGMAAYQVLSEIGRNIAGIRGVYIMGKAATLNGRVGDVMIPRAVYDEHSGNTYLYRNCISAESIDPHLTYGNVLDNQKAITVLGTFLQNREHMSVFYHEGYSDMEMEAGPFLNGIYEMVRPKRYPINEIVHFVNTPFPIGIVHYASDTPMSKGKNLGAQTMSYFGIDPTYACSVSILDEILSEEIRILSSP